MTSSTLEKVSKLASAEDGLAEIVRKIDARHNSVRSLFLSLKETIRMSRSGRLPWWSNYLSVWILFLLLALDVMAVFIFKPSPIFIFSWYIIYGLLLVVLTQVRERHARAVADTFGIGSPPQSAFGIRDWSLYVHDMDCFLMSRGCADAASIREILFILNKSVYRQKLLKFIYVTFGIAFLWLAKQLYVEFWDDVVAFHSAWEPDLSILLLGAIFLLILLMFSIHILFGYQMHAFRRGKYICLLNILLVAYDPSCSQQGE